MLKKLSLIIAILFLVGLSPKNYVLFDSEDGTYSFFVGSNSSQCEIISTTSTFASKIKKDLKEVCGESLKTTNSKSIENIIKEYDAKFLFQEKTADTITNYYYSNKISWYKTIKGKKVNLQTAKSGNSYTVGSPIIFGSF